MTEHVSVAERRAWGGLPCGFEYPTYRCNMPESVHRRGEHLFQPYERRAGERRVAPTLPDGPACTFRDCDRPEDDPRHARQDERRSPGTHVFRSAPPRRQEYATLRKMMPSPTLPDELREALDSAVEEFDNILWEDIWRSLSDHGDRDLASWSRKYVAYLRDDIDKARAALTRTAEQETRGE